MNYMQQRYYDPMIGRFLSVDPVTATSVGGNFNRYWYANDNPYRFIDPDGRQDEDAQAGRDATKKAEKEAQRRASSGQGPGTRGGTQSQYRVDGGIAGSKYNWRESSGESGNTGSRMKSSNSTSGLKPLTSCNQTHTCVSLDQVNRGDEHFLIGAAIGPIIGLIAATCEVSCPPARVWVQNHWRNLACAAGIGAAACKGDFNEVDDFAKHSELKREIRRESDEIELSKPRNGEQYP
jgi:hypothetical protein